MEGKEVKVYSLTCDGNEYLDATKFFQVREFKCKDGSDPIFISPDLVHALCVLRAYFMGKYPNATIQVIVSKHSAYRTVKHNSSVGGAKYSRHIYGTGCDFSITNVPPAEVQKACDMFWPDTYGVGYAADYTHLDVRSEKSRWKY